MQIKWDIGADYWPKTVLQDMVMYTIYKCIEDRFLKSVLS